MVESYEESSAGLVEGDASWAELVWERTLSSSKIWLIAFGGTLLIGYSWGVLSARLRRFRFSALLGLPFSMMACAPGFWFVVVVAIYSYFAWERPGFADEVVVQSTPYGNADKYFGRK